MQEPPPTFAKVSRQKNVFGLEKLDAVIGVSNLHIYAAMRGQSLEDFQKTRNAQVLYSVAGQDEGKKNWDKPAANA